MWLTLKGPAAMLVLLDALVAEVGGVIRLANCGLS